MELHSVKNEVRFSSGKTLVSIERRKLLKREFIRKISELDCSENGLRAKTHIWKMLFFYLIVSIIVKVSIDLMESCFSRCARKLVLFCFIFLL